MIAAPTVYICMWLTIAAAHCQVSLSLHNQIDLFLPFLNLLADSINLFELGDICLHEFHLPLLVQFPAFFYDSVCCCGISSHEIYTRRDCVLDESFEGELSNATGTTNCIKLVVCLELWERPYQRVQRGQDPVPAVAHSMRVQYRGRPSWDW